NTTDSGLNPTRGKSLYLALGLEGGPLQGNVNTVTQIVEAKYFKSVNKRRNVVGLRLLTAFATGYSGVVLPPFNRFYIGGEDNVRGFDIRTITPIAFIPVQQTQQVFYLDPTRLDGNGNPTLQVVNVPVVLNTITFPGGDLQAVGNVEYRIPLVGPVGMSLFFDAGLNGVLRRSQLQLDAAGVDLLRQQFPNTTFSNRLDLASGTNFKLRTSTGVEFVVQLPVLNAPFRVYYAYNLNRLRTTLRAPQGDFVIDERLRGTLPPGVLEGQVIPQLNATLGLGARALNYFEPKKTFRFTVSRTF
ncbi:MAG: BamA/TamA family outer membrane protein, partial [Terriglobales bacterium]